MVRAYSKPLKDRTCEICSKPFKPKEITQECCGKRCAHIKNARMVKNLFKRCSNIWVDVTVLLDG